jgi:hypothetical protein
MLFNGAIRETAWIYQSNYAVMKLWDYGHRQKLAAEQPLPGQAVWTALPSFHHSSVLEFLNNLWGLGTE